MVTAKLKDCYFKTVLRIEYEKEVKPVCLIAIAEMKIFTIADNHNYPQPSGLLEMKY